LVFQAVSTLIGRVPSLPFIAAYRSFSKDSESKVLRSGSLLWLQRMIEGWLRSRRVSALAWSTMLSCPATKSWQLQVPRIAVSSMTIRPISSATSIMYGLAGSWWKRTTL
jgi:hypothetical protein